MQVRHGIAWPETAVGIGLLLLAAIAAYGTANIPSPPYARIGPAVVPWGITAGIAVLGALLAYQGMRGGWEREQDGGFDVRSLLWLLAGLAFNLTLIDGVNVSGSQVLPHLGFILSSTAMFVCTARAFGSTRPVRDVLIAFSLAAVAYLGFDRALDYKIGTGLVEGLLTSIIESLQTWRQSAT
ncbi:MAG: tripartite tricarboxylate transporter TctB family protein [Hyphomicrobiaceae bacterium]|nr:MAG: tripartite tricarboxylate transporter TctB family protein [Hyphomicrobiaceae bacterium]